jgi:DNA (cytosine-5)-methyltransferase 1
VAVDLFAGAGGMSLGFEQAGFDVKAAVEIDPIHACIHKYNFPECTVIPESVQNLSGADIKRLANIEGKVDLVFGGAPCQGFSMIGKRSMDDPRNSLVMDFVRIVEELDADYFVFENVKGLTVGTHKKFLEELIEAFESRNYKVSMPWAVLNACNYGVPQNRKRLFLMGAKIGKKLPSYPLPRSIFSQKSTDFPYENVTCADALDDIPDADLFDELLDSDVVKADLSGNISHYAREMRCVSESAWHFGCPRLWDATRLTSSIRTSHSEISQLRFTETPVGEVEPISRFFKLAPDGVSNTLRAGTDASRGAFTSPRPIHYKFPRCVTVREMARLHGFPDWFRFHKTKWHGARQIGNAVPPPLARAVASSVMAAMGVTPTAISTAIELGHDALLSMDMSQASDYWGIPSPIQKRDRRSGTHKRTQFETERERLSKLAI